MTARTDTTMWTRARFRAVAGFLMMVVSGACADVAPPDDTDGLAGALPAAVMGTAGSLTGETVSIFYGSLVTDPEILASIDHEVYGTFAEMDSGIPPATVNKFVEALRSAGVENDVHIYDDVNHGF